MPTQVRQTRPIIFNEYNGLSDSLFTGAKGSFFKLVGLDIHSKRAALQVQQAMAKDSGTTITSICKVAIPVSDGSRLWFEYTTGKIYRESGGTYTLVYTTVPTTGNSGCLGAKEYNGKIYWATQNYEHYIAVANIGSAASWTANAVPNWKLFGATDANWHPHEVVNASLFIGDNHQVAKVDSSNVFTVNVLDLIAPNAIKTMKAYDIDLVIGTLIDLTVNHSWVIRWDTIQTSWQFMEPVMEDGVNCLFWSGQQLLANAGQYGMIYSYNGRSLIPHMRLPAINNGWSPSHNGEILPNAAGVWMNLAVIGFTANNGNPLDQAVYVLGSYSRNHPMALSEDFPISSGNFTNITIGAIIGSNENLFVSWQDTTSPSSQGVDKLDWSNKYASAFIETIAIPLDDTPENQTTIQRLFALYQSMPTGTSVAFSYYSNWGNKKTPTNSVVTETNDQTTYVDEGVDCRTIRLRVDFTISANNSPVLELFGLLPAN